MPESLLNIKLPDFLLPLLLLATIALVLHFIARRYSVKTLKNMKLKSATRWDKILIQCKVIHRAIHFIPATVISFGLPFVFSETTQAFTNLSKMLNLYYIIVAFGVYEALLSAVRDGYERYEVSKRIGIRGFIQAFKVVGALFCIILLISQLADRSPLYFLSGLGAFTAILLLIFKDSILGLVAGIQLSTMDLVRKGDWIEMPKHGADGDIVDISLTTVRIRNFDMTISAIPAYELVSSSFRNWRGMTESGGRRIMRSIHIDLSSIEFLSSLDVDRLMKIKLLKPYLRHKISEIEKSNEQEFADEDLSCLSNGRKLTNIGTFRAYCIAYLRSHQKVHQGMIQLVRQLEPTPQGLPLQLYVFAKSTVWVEYESIQADIFDHLLAILPEFGLRTFQSVSGADVGNGLKSTLPNFTESPS
ncbi:mechanosensitive ion channel [Chitinispirillales bacterium ANBcel5]|uniref:mechanosensitive ion channel family protein n=1 Tax=Cellulosispirillum alkaliphilum TaxID=3039283 RepID=UPI002A5416D7|nr:mechanosensitive ion channel [Chitinispirillales bacterium ANBcel5]